MEITGKIIAVLPLQSGTSAKGNQWQKQECVIETQEQYPKKCCFTLFGDKVSLCPKVGDECTVKFDIDAHEYNGRWFNQINAWSVEVKGGQQDVQEQQTEQAQPAQQATEMPPQAKPQEESSELPF